MLCNPYFMENDDWFRYDEKADTNVLTEEGKRHSEVVESYEAFQKFKKEMKEMLAEEF